MEQHRFVDHQYELDEARDLAHSGLDLVARLKVKAALLQMVHQSAEIDLQRIQVHEQPNTGKTGEGRAGYEQ